MIWITQAIIVIIFGKDILHKRWINVILCLHNDLDVNVNVNVNEVHLS